MLRLLLSDNDDSFTLNLAHLLHAATGAAPCVINHRMLPLQRNDKFATAAHQPTPEHASNNTTDADAKPATGADIRNHTATPPAVTRGSQPCKAPVSSQPLPNSTKHSAPRTTFSEAGKFDLIVISPGPGSPDEYPHYAPLLQSGIPVLGICLGMQIINRHFGGDVEPLAGCVHGKSDTVTMLDAPRTVTVGRYHSLHCTTIGNGLEVTGTNPQGIVMALRHTRLPIYGYQFHPESFLTDQGVWCIRHALRSLHLI